MTLANKHSEPLYISILVQQCRSSIVRVRPKWHSNNADQSDSHSSCCLSESGRPLTSTYRQYKGPNSDELFSYSRLKCPHFLSIALALHRKLIHKSTPSSTSIMTPSSLTTILGFYRVFFPNNLMDATFQSAFSNSSCIGTHTMSVRGNSSSSVF
jgi:hypothetical protein